MDIPGLWSFPEGGNVTCFWGGFKTKGIISVVKYDKNWSINPIYLIHTGLQKKFSYKSSDQFPA